MRPGPEGIPRFPRLPFVTDTGKNARLWGRAAVPVEGRIPTWRILQQ